MVPDIAPPPSERPTLPVPAHTAARRYDSRHPETLHDISRALDIITGPVPPSRVPAVTP